ncbi:UDP-N-acetylmuramyl-tripeptide synthetase [Candidatus Woesebacteria bacterium]|nr:UDP-N-acetylmuramyl-tripeptide synthetase [Candidatus Woesebacteria bacterium]
MLVKLLLYKLKRVFHFFKTGILEGLPAQISTGFPNKKLTIIAITGTDGKTTTSTLVYTILKAAGIKVGLISTVAAFRGSEAIETGFHVTSPQPKLVYSFMKQMVDEGYTHLVLETTSHGAYQFRNWGIQPDVAGLTNISHEHFDYHLSYTEYLKAKLLILKKAKIAFINADDPSYKRIKELKQFTRSMRAYSAEDELPTQIKKAITARFPEDYNQMNARLAYRISHELGVTDAMISKGISQFTGIPGRMEVVTEKPIRVIVDFAHTPNALESALTSIRSQHPTGKLIAVFGCAGLRDFTKRPLMGKVGSELADLAIFTAEDPRTEDIWSIIRQMKEGIIDTHSKVISIANRQEAITLALLKYAQPGDTIGIFGKGHEQSMCYGTVETPWNDSEAVRSILGMTTQKN